MNDFKKGASIVLTPDEGEAHWQPLPSTGYIIAKITPYNSPYDNFSTGIQVLEPGTHVRQHAHERAHELLFIYRGTGYAELDGERHGLEEGTMILVGRAVQHVIHNTGSTQMKLLWMISPPGLEDWFRAIGRPRRPGDPLPEPFDRPDDVQAIQDQQRFIRPEDA